MSCIDVNSVSQAFKEFAFDLDLAKSRFLETPYKVSRCCIFKCENKKVVNLAFKELEKAFADNIEKLHSQLKSYSIIIDSPHLKARVGDISREYLNPLIDKEKTSKVFLEELDFHRWRINQCQKEIEKLDVCRREEELALAKEIFKLPTHQLERSKDLLALEQQLSKYHPRWTEYVQAGKKVDELLLKMDSMIKEERLPKKLANLEWKIKNLESEIGKQEREIVYWYAFYTAPWTRLRCFPSEPSPASLQKERQFFVNKINTANLCLVHLIDQMAQANAELIRHEQLLESVPKEHEAFISQYEEAAREFIALEETGIEKLYHALNEQYKNLFFQEDPTYQRRLMRDEVFKSQLKDGQVFLLQLHMKDKPEVSRCVEELTTAYQDFVVCSEENLQIHKERIQKLHSELDKLLS